MPTASYAPILIAASLSAILCSGCALSGHQHIGGMLGDPTGVSYLAEIDEDSALAAGIGLGFADGDAFHGHVDYIRMVAHYDQVDVYVGAGARFRARSDDKPGNDDRDKSDFGPRVPIGITHVFGNSGWHIFLEIAPGLDLVHAKGTFDLAIGARVAF